MPTCMPVKGSPTCRSKQLFNFCRFGSELKVSPPICKSPGGSVTPGLQPALPPSNALLLPPNKHDRLLFPLPDTTQIVIISHLLCWHCTRHRTGGHHHHRAPVKDEKSGKGKLLSLRLQGKAKVNLKFDSKDEDSHILYLWSRDRCPSLNLVLVAVYLHSSLFSCFLKDLYYSSKVKFIQAIYKHKACLFLISIWWVLTNVYGYYLHTHNVSVIPNSSRWPFKIIPLPGPDLSHP